MRQRALLFLIVLVCFFLHPVRASALPPIVLSDHEETLLAQGEIIVREISSGQGNGKTMEAVGLIKAGVDQVYQVLTAYEDYGKFMPNVSDVAVVERNADSVVLNYTLTLPLGKIKKYRLRLESNKREKGATLQWRKVEWPGLRDSETIRDTSGYWLLQDHPQREGHVVVLYHVYTDPGRVPLGLGWIVDILSKKSVPEVVIKTRERIGALQGK